ncbi:hypothetical protein JF541_18950 [Marinobacter hydrocarbonoclasticus]|uniref:hypothetical protein n=1 Tax=Marinobacter nauticus TaxID=2743 RepID=UPI001A8C36AF|nr:hypothetical protein [Marinobacter nauticus]MBN8241239.1 hypothetical protein [Marinobacter nauticus]
MLVTNRFKAVAGLLILIVLALLNIQKYWVGTDSEAESEWQYREVPNLAIPNVLKESGDASHERDIFMRIETDQIEIAEDAVEETVVEAPPEEERRTEAIAEIGNYKDFDLLGVSRRAGATMALVNYKGRSYYVAVGDVVGGRFFIESIDESGVYVSTQ